MTAQPTHSYEPEPDLATVITRAINELPPESQNTKRR